MSELIKIRKGLNIRLKGRAEKIVVKTENLKLFGIKPGDFIGLNPKLMVQPGDQVKAGTPLFHDKYQPDAVFVSPVSGKVSAINRGDRRVIQEVVIESDGLMTYEQFGKSDPDSLSREMVVHALLKGGCWPFIRQRPYGTMASIKDVPKSIFISGFDTAPLAPDLDFVLTGQNTEFQAGINALAKLTTGKVFLNIPEVSSTLSIFPKIQKVHLTRFAGPHPAGNVGIQIHHLDPVNKGEVVWYVNPLDVLIIGRLFLNGVFDASRVVAVTGSEVLKPRYFKTILGTAVKSLLEKNLAEGEVRIISGNVLTGTHVHSGGFLGFYDCQITVIPEGKHFEFLGWALPGLGKFSASRSFLSWLFPDREYRLDTNLMGGHRAFVVTGQYEKVLPMKVYPMQLLKSILIEDVEQMERLGIYEVSEEDFALCEYVCTSKMDVQAIIRKGLDLVRKEMS
jgi:Na+-transporting NADH:ubiquinone oxidoreductase subunit A